MDKQEAIEVLNAELAEYRTSSYSQLAVKIDEGDHDDITGPSGAEYQVEIQFFWDDKPNGDIRVLSSIDDGGWRAFVPLCDDFIMARDGRFVGEEGCGS